MFEVIFITTNLTRNRIQRCERWAEAASIKQLVIIDQSTKASSHSFGECVTYVHTHKPKSAISARSEGLRYVSKDFDGIFFLDDDIDFNLESAIANVKATNKTKCCISFTLLQPCNFLKLLLTSILCALFRWGEYADNRPLCMVKKSLGKRFSGYRTVTSAGLMYIPKFVIEAGAFEKLKCRGKPIQGGDVELAQIVFASTKTRFYFSSEFVGHHLVAENSPNKTQTFIKNRLDVKNIVLGYHTKNWRYYGACCFDAFFAIASCFQTRSFGPMRGFIRSIK